MSTAAGSSGDADRVIEADGLLLTPGWVDVHTHYDAQASWDPYLTPSSWHGVTSVVMGNCGVGFAPAAPDRHEWLIELMEGVEDIPGSAMTEGMTWQWESFEEFLDALDARHYALDLGAQIAHGPVRGYVMGDRGAANEPATSGRHRRDVGDRRICTACWSAWASRRHGLRCTSRSRASWCPAPTRPPTNSSGSPMHSDGSATVSSSSHPSTSTYRPARCRGCARSHGAPVARSASTSTSRTAHPTSGARSSPSSTSPAPKASTSSRRWRVASSGS